MSCLGCSIHFEDILLRFSSRIELLIDTSSYPLKGKQLSFQVFLSYYIHGRDWIKDDLKLHLIQSLSNRDCEVLTVMKKIPMENLQTLLFNRLLETEIHSHNGV